MGQCEQADSRRVLQEIEPGQTVLQTACVYGTFSNKLADRVGADGQLTIVDIAPIQVRHCRRKLRDQSHARVVHGDAADPGPDDQDVVCCFFLIHEVPAEYKLRIVDAVLGRVKPGGKAVFVDYHRPVSWHPLRPVMNGVFALLEPFAFELWDTELRDLASGADEFTWTKRTLFGGLYQHVVAVRNT